jgi:hypothetical protein
MSRKLARAAIAGSALIATLALAACSGTGPDTDANSNAQPNPPTSQTEQTPEAQPSDDGREVDLHATYTWADGTTARITSIRRVPLSEDAMEGNPGEQETLLLTVKLTASDKGLEPMDPTSSLQYGADGTIAEPSLYAEAADHMQGGPGRLGPGRSLTGTLGYVVPKGEGPLVFTFNPSHPMYDAADPNTAHADATFVGSA